MKVARLKVIVPNTPLAGCLCLVSAVVSSAIAYTHYVAWNSLFWFEADSLTTFARLWGYDDIVPAFTAASTVAGLVVGLAVGHWLRRDAISLLASVPLAALLSTPICYVAAEAFTQELPRDPCFGPPQSDIVGALSLGFAPLLVGVMLMAVMATYLWPGLATVARVLRQCLFYRAATGPN